MRCQCKTCDPSYVSDPVGLLKRVDAAVRLRPGTDWVGVIANDDERLLGVRQLQPQLSEETDMFDLERLLRECLPGDPDPFGLRPQSAFFVRCRQGRVVPLPHDHDGWCPWMNAMSMTRLSCADWYLVTDHGWRSLISSQTRSGDQVRLRRIAAVPGQVT
jgi:hypothetical protein